MWGYSLQFWQVVVFWLWVVAAVGGGVAVAASFASSIVSYYISDATQKDADREIAKANASASSANEAAGKANVRAGQLGLQVEQEKTRRLQLQKSMQWRTLTKEQCAVFASYIASNPISKIVFISTVRTDPEAYAFASSILRCIEIAKIENVGISRDYESAVGVRILSTKAGDQIKVLENALLLSGIDLIGGDSSGHFEDSDAIHLVVGSKMPVTFEAPE